MHPFEEYVYEILFGLLPVLIAGFSRVLIGEEVDELPVVTFDAADDTPVAEQSRGLVDLLTNDPKTLSELVIRVGYSPSEAPPVCGIACQPRRPASRARAGRSSISSRMPASASIDAT